MTASNNERAASARGRLPSIFDAFPPGTRVTLDDLELAMHADFERRALAALDRALVRMRAGGAGGETGGAAPPACSTTD